MSKLAQWCVFAVCSIVASYFCGRAMFDEWTEAKSGPPIADDIILYVGILIVVLIAWYLVFSPRTIWERLLDFIDLRSGFEDFPWHILLYAMLIGGTVLLGGSFELAGFAAVGLGSEWFLYRVLSRESSATMSAPSFISMFLVVRLASAYVGLQGARAGGWFQPEWPGPVVSLAAVECVLLAAGVSIAIGIERNGSGRGAS